MTAPLRTGEPVTVNVALGTRAYDIAIGRGLVGELGTRIAALKPGASAAIVSDETVAARHLKTAEARARRRRHPRRADRRCARRGVEKLARAGRCLRPAARREDRAQ